jgi:putative metalloprotease
MLKFSPFLLAILVGLFMYWFSSKRTLRMLDKQSTPLRDPKINAGVAKLAETLDLPKVDVHVYEVEMVNGLAAPDGRVFITRGFLDKYKLGEVSADEMVSVIAHELGHVALGHSRKRMFDFAGTNALRTVLAIVIGRYIPFVGVYIANFIAQLIGARLSRNDEFEADAYAAALMVKSGHGIHPQVRMFKKLSALAGSANGPAWLMSHPKTEDRIAAIERLAIEWADKRLE